jgi:hypothetical protein
MAYLTKADFTSKSVASSLMLKKGGGSGAGVYIRSRKNMLTSPNLIRWLGVAGSAVRANCSQSDHCTGNAALVGKTAPDGKPYRSCDITERKARLEGARTCAKSTLSGLSSR